MYISSAGSHIEAFWLQLEVLTWNFRREINENSASRAGSRAFQQTPIKHHRIVIANIGLLLLDGKHKLDWK